MVVVVNKKLISAENLVDSLRASGDWDDVMKNIRTWKSQYSGSISSSHNSSFLVEAYRLTVQGEVAMSRKKYDEARKYFIRALHQENTYVDALILLAELNMVSGIWSPLNVGLNMSHVRTKPTGLKIGWLTIPLVNRSVGSFLKRDLPHQNDSSIVSPDNAANPIRVMQRGVENGALPFSDTDSFEILSYAYLHCKKGNLDFSPYRLSIRIRGLSSLLALYEKYHFPRSHLLPRPEISLVEHSPHSGTPPSVKLLSTLSEPARSSAILATGFTPISESLLNAIDVLDTLWELSLSSLGPELSEILPVVSTACQNEAQERLDKLLKKNQNGSFFGLDDRHIPGSNGGGDVSPENDGPSRVTEEEKEVDDKETSLVWRLGNVTSLIKVNSGTVELCSLSMTLFSTLLMQSLIHTRAIQRSLSDLTEPFISLASADPYLTSRPLSVGVVDSSGAVHPSTASAPTNVDFGMAGLSASLSGISAVMRAPSHFFFEPLISTPPAPTASAGSGSGQSSQLTYTPSVFELFVGSLCSTLPVSLRELPIALMLRLPVLLRRLGCARGAAAATLSISAALRIFDNLRSHTLSFRSLLAAHCRSTLCSLLDGAAGDPVQPWLDAALCPTSFKWPMLPKSISSLPLQLQAERFLCHASRLAANRPRGPLSEVLVAFSSFSSVNNVLFSGMYPVIPGRSSLHFTSQNDIQSQSLRSLAKELAWQLHVPSTHAVDLYKRALLPSLGAAALVAAEAARSLLVVSPELKDAWALFGYASVCAQLLLDGTRSSSRFWRVFSSVHIEKVEPFDSDSRPVEEENPQTRGLGLRLDIGLEEENRKLRSANGPRDSPLSQHPSVDTGMSRQRSQRRSGPSSTVDGETSKAWDDVLVATEGASVGSEPFSLPIPTSTGEGILTASMLSRLADSAKALGECSHASSFSKHFLIPDAARVTYTEKEEPHSPGIEIDDSDIFWKKVYSYLNTDPLLMSSNINGVVNTAESQLLMVKEQIKNILSSNSNVNMQVGADSNLNTTILRQVSAESAEPEASAFPQGHSSSLDSSTQRYEQNVSHLSPLLPPKGELLRLIALSRSANALPAIEFLQSAALAAGACASNAHSHHKHNNFEETAEKDPLEDILRAIRSHDVNPTVPVASKNPSDGSGGNNNDAFSFVGVGWNEKHFSHSHHCSSLRTCALSRLQLGAALLSVARARRGASSESLQPPQHAHMRTVDDPEAALLRNALLCVFSGAFTLRLHCIHTGHLAATSSRFSNQNNDVVNGLQFDENDNTAPQNNNSDNNNNNNKVDAVELIAKKLGAAGIAMNHLPNDDWHFPYTASLILAELGELESASQMAAIASSKVFALVEDIRSSINTQLTSISPEQLFRSPEQWSFSPVDFESSSASNAADILKTRLIRLGLGADNNNHSYSHSTIHNNHNSQNNEITIAGAGEVLLSVDSAVTLPLALAVAILQLRGQASAAAQVLLKSIDIFRGCARLRLLEALLSARECTKACERGVTQADLTVSSAVQSALATSASGLEEAFFDTLPMEFRQNPGSSISPDEMELATALSSATSACSLFAATAEPLDASTSLSGAQASFSTHGANNVASVGAPPTLQWLVFARLSQAYYALQLPTTDPAQQESALGALTSVQGPLSVVKNGPLITDLHRILSDADPVDTNSNREDSVSGASHAASHRGTHSGNLSKTHQEVFPLVALEEMGRACGITASEAAAVLMRSAVEPGLRSLRAAEAARARARMLEPAEAAVSLAAAIVALNMGRISACEEEVAACLATAPSYVPALVLAGQLAVAKVILAASGHLTIGDPHSFLAILQSPIKYALDLKGIPGEEVKDFRAVAHHLLEEARGHAETAKKLAPNDPQVWALLARVYACDGAHDLATDAALRSIELREYSVLVPFSLFPWAMPAWI